MRNTNDSLVTDPLVTDDETVTVSTSKDNALLFLHLKTVHNLGDFLAKVPQVNCVIFA